MEENLEAYRQENNVKILGISYKISSTFGYPTGLSCYPKGLTDRILHPVQLLFW